MKNTIKRILCLALALTLLAGMMTVTASAESTDVKVNIYSKYEVNQVQFSDYMGRPFINDGGRTLCPFRVIANFMGVQVFWDNTAREACFSRTNNEVWINETEKGCLDFTVRFTINSNEIWTSYTVWDKDGNFVQAFDQRSLMDTFPIIRDGRTYAPIRFLAEAFRYKVGWDNDSRTVMITSPDTEDWGQMMYNELWTTPYQQVNTAKEAEYWVDEYISRAYGMAKGQYILQGEDSLVNNDGEKIDGWMFTLEPYNDDWSPSGIRYDVFIGKGGETFYYDSDEGEYLQVLGTYDQEN